MKLLNSSLSKRNLTKYKLIINLAMVSLCSLFLFACGGQTSIKDPVITEPIEVVTPPSFFATVTGVWQQQGYGNVITIDEKNNQYSRYQLTEVSCIKEFSDSLSNLDNELDSKEYNDNSVSLSFQFHGNYTVYHYNKLQTLPTLCDNDGSQSSTDPQENFQVLWHTFNEQYAFFSLRNLDWQKQYDLYQSQVTVATTNEQLMTLFSDMLMPLNDGHITLDDGVNKISVKAVTPLESRIIDEFSQQNQIEDLAIYVEQQQTNAQAIIGSYLNNQIKSAANGKLFWGALSNNIGYLWIDAMTGFATETDYDNEMAALEQALDEAMQDFSDKKAMVIDLRFNGGGRGESALRIANRFIENKTEVVQFKARNGDTFTEAQMLSLTPHANKQFLAPVIILTSSTTASAAEHLVMNMQASRDVVIIGETTAGVFSEQLNKKLPNGWQIQLSNEVYQTLNGESFEANGISPTIQMDAFLKADRDNNKDSMIERALAEFTAMGF